MTANERITELLKKKEQSMRDNAAAICYTAIDMANLDKEAAHKALEGIVQYLQEKIEILTA